MHIKSLLKGAFVVSAGALFILGAAISLYFSIAIGGALWGASGSKIDDVGAPKEITIYLLTSYLHADIAVPLLPETAQRFGFLADSTFPFYHPDLRYLAFGWGAKAFYTTAGAYSDITLNAATKAIMGDESVMHIAPMAALATGPDSIAIQLNQRQFEQLLEAIESTFTKAPDGQAVLLAGQTHGYGDVFYESEGNFNILNPCNIWAATILRQTGIKLGAWTPTTQALKLSYEFWNISD